MTFREKALRLAVAELGVKESPAGSNSGPRVNEYLASAGLGPGYPWCMAFMHWCFERAGLDFKHPNLASVGFFEDWAGDMGYLVPTPARGDLICYRFDADNWPDHVGIVERVFSGSVDAIEGNTAIGNDANGGMVMRRGRALTRAKFARIPGSIPLPEVEIVKPWIPLLFHWYLNERKPGIERPASINGVAIPAPPWPQEFWAMVESADLFRAAKPDSSAELVAGLRAKIAAARSALA